MLNPTLFVNECSHWFLPENFRNSCWMVSFCVKLTSYLQYVNEIGIISCVFGDGPERIIENAIWRMIYAR